MKNFSFYKGGSAFWYLILIGFSLSYTPAPAKTTLRQLQSLPQQSQISGTITDGTSPLPGVTITIKGQSKTVVSDFDGKFTITASSTDILIFRYMDFKTLTVPVDGRSILNIRMQEDATALQEVKINAGYYSVRESERTGSIAKISAAAIEKQPVTNVLAAMQGSMAGVNITQETGIAGGGFSIQIRGQNSLRTVGNDPLYIIDGVPYSSEAIGNSITSFVLSKASSPLNSINPESVESIEVLKDADATAIYGSRGANGVVLITTKKGKEGKAKFTANFSCGLGQITRYMDLMNTQQYVQMRKEAYANDGISVYPSNAYDLNGKWDGSRYTNWQKILIGGTADFTSAGASVSGGNAQTQFLMNGNYSKQTTVLPGDFSYHKKGVLLNLNHESENKKFRLTFSGGYTLQDNDQPSIDFTREARTIAPNAPTLYDDQGNLNWKFFNNPLRNLEGKFKAKTNDLIANTLISYQLMDGLELKSSFGFTDLHHVETSTSPSTIYNPAFGFGSESSTIYIDHTQRQSWIVEPQLNWRKGLGNAKIEVLLGSTFQQQKGNQLVQQGTGFSSNSLIYNLASTSTIAVLSAMESVYRYQAFFGRANFNWQGRYILNLTGRRDGSSRFGPGNQFSNFGAIGGAWLFSKEALLDPNSFLSFGKLRASYGTSGNDQIGDYQYLDTYASSGISYQGTIGLDPTRLFNPDFGWESNKKLEIALETGLLRDRLFFTAAWYRNRSSNQLVGTPLPATTGFTSVQANLNATVQNSGVELTLRTVNFQKASFSWTTSLNLTVARNKLLSFADLESSTYSGQFVIGKALNIQKVYHLTDVNPQTGIYRFEDVNQDGKITPADDKQTVKDLNPEYYGGIQNQLQYKELQLDFLFQFVKQQNWNAVSMFGVPGTRSNQLADVANHWRTAGDLATYQGYTSGTNSNRVQAYFNYTMSDAAITDASYIRLKNISLSYTIPEKWLKSVQCRLSVQGQNLLTFTRYKGADPEFKAVGYLPPLKVLTTGVQLTF
ncbi:SusC/RagA family TonB-linked outer membrane protein [Flavobacterium sp. ZS1P14]|uniref:SusC/RagA family TonB-linked outer membrane protein n=1 Tax=Flavobacterium sp. ZS1P14 TaxID=3401729 RepID=UPI003AAA5C1D